PDAGRALQREQDAFLARRNAAFGQPGYDLRQAMKDRLGDLLAIKPLAIKPFAIKPLAVDPK
ncbi:MAG: hypothetical protein WCB02_02390, partial [Bradyrhizobium sp.]